MAILVVGINHKTVPLEVLEQLTFPPDTLPKGLARLDASDALHEGAILSTCNRTEIYATVHRFHPAVQAVRHILADASGVPQERIATGLYTYYDATAVRHLFAVASGVDSMVIGEPEILGQVKDAFLTAQGEGTARRMLTALFERALRVGKRVRTETLISRHVVSLPQAAARVAADLAGGIEEKKVAVVGAGRMAELAARAARDLGARDIVICNRTPDRARALAARLDGQAVGLDALPELLGDVDALLSATTSEAPILAREAVVAALAGRSQPLVCVDLGLPRDIDPSARDVDGFVLRDIDDLRTVAEEGAERRAAEIPKVEEIVAEEVDRFCAWERSLALDPSIAALHRWASELRDAEVSKAARSMGLDPDGEQRLDAAARALVNKLLHLPVSRVKDLVSGPDGQVYLEVFQELFDLDAPER